MTNRILQTDIELAKKLLQAGRPDSEIVKALTYRKIDHPKAEHLVAALKAGEDVAPEIDVNYEAGQSLKARRAEADNRQSAPAPARRPAATAQGGGKAWVVWLILFLLLASVAAFFLMRSPTTQTQEAPETDTATGPGQSEPADPGMPK